MTLQISQQEKDRRKAAREASAISQKGVQKVYRSCSYPGCVVVKRFFGARMFAAKVYCSKDHWLRHVKESAFSFTCIVCGKQVFTQPSQIRLRARVSCSVDCRGKLRSMTYTCRRGVVRTSVIERRKTYTKHQLDRIARYSPEAALWRKDVFHRDDFTCQLCGVRGGYLEADHIKPWAFFPDLRFDLTNGRTLCRPCHDKTKIGAKKLREMYADQIV